MPRLIRTKIAAQFLQLNCHHLNLDIQHFATISYHIKRDKFIFLLHQENIITKRETGLDYQNDIPFFFLYVSSSQSELQKLLLKMVLKTTLTKSQKGGGSNHSFVDNTKDSSTRNHNYNLNICGSSVDTTLPFFFSNSASRLTLYMSSSSVLPTYLIQILEKCNLEKR